MHPFFGAVVLVVPADVHARVGAFGGVAENLSYRRIFWCGCRVDRCHGRFAGGAGEHSARFKADPPFMPAEASLTCSNEQGQVLRPHALHRLDPATRLQLLTGVPVNTLTAPNQRDHRADYPRIDIGTAQPAAPHADATPRPKAVR